MLRIGIDFGGVCSALTHEYEEKDEKEAPDDLINIDRCIEALTALVEKGHHIYLVSFCGSKRAMATREWLCNKYPSLFNYNNLFFVKKRRDKDKICLYKAMDVMIDDRTDVLDSITKAYTIHFRGDPSFGAKDHSYKGVAADSWAETVEIIDKLEPLRLTEDRTINIKPLCYQPYYLS